VGADVDAAALVEEILTEVARKKRDGLYPATLMADIEIAMDPLESALEDLRRAAALSFRPPASSRRRIVGAPATFVKGGFRLALRWYTQWMVAQVSTFASSVVALATGFTWRLKEHESRLDQLSKELADERARIRVQPHQPSPRVAVDDPRLLAQPTHDLPSEAELEQRSRGIADAEGPEPLAFVDLFGHSPGPVVDVGCGQGEFLIAMSRAGVEAYGVETRSDMAARCRRQGLQVRQEDPMSHLADVEPASLGGIFSAHLVDYLAPQDLVRLFHLATQALDDGGLVVLEAHSLKNHATFEGPVDAPVNRTRHIRPDVLAFLAENAGLRDIEVRYLVNAEQSRPLQLELAADQSIHELLLAVNENFRRIDDLLFGRLDFAVIARR
jgi:SAM-dependent methyltransferase